MVPVPVPGWRGGGWFQAGEGRGLVPGWRGAGAGSRQGREGGWFQAGEGRGLVPGRGGRGAGSRQGREDAKPSNLGFPAMQGTLGYYRGWDYAVTFPR